MEKGKIRRRKIYDNHVEMRRIEDFFITDAEENYESHIETYNGFESSIDGRYICSDLMKETFPLYSESESSRYRYNVAVHNSAAVLTEELFNRKIKDPSIKKCIILTGVPGAGKTFFAQSLGKTLEEDTMIYEGSIINSSIFEKIENAQKEGIEVSIIVVNPTIELSVRNVVVRQFEIGRDASPALIADMFYKIPLSLMEIHKKYPNIDLAIYNKYDNYSVEDVYGFEYLSLLDHGRYEEVLSSVEMCRDAVLSELKENYNIGEGNKSL